MGLIRKRLPSPALVIGIVALIVALTGSAYAGSKLGLKGLSDAAKNEVVGTGPLIYVRTFASVPVNNTTGIDVAATCPAGTHVIGGGIRVGNDQVQLVNDSHPTATGWAGTVFNAGSVAHGATTTAICGRSRVVIGTP